MKFIVRNKIVLTSGLTLVNLTVVILVALLFTNHTTKFLLSEEKIFSLIHNTEEIMLELARSEADIKNYLLTSNHDDLQRFRSRKAPLQEKLKRLQKVYTKKEQIDQFTQLQSLVLSEIELLERAAETRSLLKNSHLDKIKQLQATLIDSQKLLLKEREEDLEIELRSREYVLVSASIASLLISFFALSTIVKDLDDKRKKEKELESKNATKDRFFGLISHDLKGPAQNMISLSDMLLNEPDISCEERNAFIHLINACAKKNFNLLNNLLEWARLQMGNIQNKAVQFNLNDACEECIQLMDEKAYRKSIKISNRIPPELMVYADRNAICSVIRNLISNGLKYTKQGGKISIYCQELKNEMVEVAVADTGIGMDPQTRKKLFKAGKQISMGGTEGETGTGIGLLLCKEFIETNNGWIRCESKKGEGSTFIFTIPTGKI